MNQTREELLAELKSARQLIREQAQRIDNLQASEQRANAILMSSRDIIINADSNSRIIFWNKAAEAEFGYLSEEVIGQPLTHIMPDQFRDLHIAGLKRVAETGKTKIIGTIVEVIGLRKNGIEFPIELSLSSFSEGDEIFFNSIIRNITARKEIEQALKDSKNELQDALVKEKELGALKDRFMTMIAHEFRTPLAIISVSNQLLSNYLHRLTETKRKEHLGRIKEQITNLTDMLESIGTMLQNTGNPVELDLEAINLKDYCEAIISDFQKTITSKHVIIFSCEDSLRNIQVDKKCITIIVRNLLSNAIKYSDGGSQITINISIYEKGQLLQIRDEGVGIPMEDLKWIFTPYHRAINVENIKGIGLGLQAVKELVELHNGEITVQSEIDKGTVFNVYLPYQETP